jgi:hypothetical protein
VNQLRREARTTIEQRYHRECWFYNLTDDEKKGDCPKGYTHRQLSCAATKRSTVYIGAGGHVILAFWHAQQLMIPSGYRGAGAHVLISQHGDGEIIARIIARFGHQAIRGSNTRGGAGALRALIKLGRASKDLVVDPSGPKDHDRWTSSVSSNWPKPPDFQLFP